MWFNTRAVILTSGVGIGSSELVAFDAALRGAAIADFNLIRVTSIVPPHVPIYKMRKGAAEISGDGLMLPTVFAKVGSPDPAKLLSAAVAVGIPGDRNRAGVIFVNKGEDLEEEACVAGVREMIHEGMGMLRRMDKYSVEHASAMTRADGSGKWSAVFAALCFADDQLWPYFEHQVEPLS